MQIRKSLLEDAPHIAEIFQAAVASSGEKYTDEQKRAWANQLDLEAATTLIDSRRRITWIAEEDAPIGFVTLDGNILQMLYVRPDHQGKGLGSRLLDLAERAATAMDRTHVTLYASHNALQFFKGHGYKLQSIEATSIDEVPFTRMLLKKSLSRQ